MISLINNLTRQFVPRWVSDDEGGSGSLMRMMDVYEILKLTRGRKVQKGKKIPRMILDDLIALFRWKRVPYRLLYHRNVYNAAALADSINAPAKEVAKVVILRADGHYVMAVLPACRMIDVRQFAITAEGKDLAFAREKEIKKLFPDCETGAMPPFGNLYNLRVYVDESLAREEYILFPAGSHHESIKMGFGDFKRLVLPTVGQFALEPLTKRMI